MTDYRKTYPNGVRFEFHVTTASLVAPACYLIDWQKRMKYSDYPDYILDMLFARDREFLDNFTVIEEHNGLEPLVPTYGTGWKLCIPPEEKWWKGHPRLRRWLQSMPWLSVELNDRGVKKSYYESVMQAVYAAASS